MFAAGLGGSSVPVQAAEQVAQRLGVGAEGCPALAGQGHRGFLDPDPFLVLVLLM